MKGPKSLAAVAAVALVAASGIWWFRTRGEVAAPLKAGRPVVVVELFSAEGCRSCPPADGYLATLDREQPIDDVTVIALELHVDYWDRSGWTDPFGSPELTARQKAYAPVLPNHSVYTPEIVFDGARQMVGGDEDRGREQILAAAREDKARVSIEVTGRGKVSVDVKDDRPAHGDDPLETWLAVTESHVTSSVSAGENQGRVLAHAPIVRELRKLGVVTESFRRDVEIDIAFGWKPGALRYVAFVQRAAGRKIEGAAARNATD